MRFLTFFFLRNAFHSKRLLWMAVLGLAPVLFALVLLVFPVVTGGGIDAPALFRQVSFSLCLHVLLPLLAAFIGTGILAEEVEDRTLPYLLTRPVARWKIVASKSLAACITAGLILLVSVVLTYTLLSAAAGITSWFRHVKLLLRVSGVLLLGVAAYVPLFAFLGASIKKPVLVGLLFAFGWENIVSYMPHKIRFLTIVTYLHDLFPQAKVKISTSGIDLETIFSYLVSSETLSPAQAIATLVGIFIVFTGLTVSFLYLKEYRLEQG